MIDDKAQDAIMEAYEKTVLNEKLDPKSSYSKWQKNHKMIKKILDDTLKEYQSMDNAVGGTSMIDHVKSSHEYLMLKLKQFSNELFTATPEYGELFSWERQKKYTVK